MNFDEIMRQFGVCDTVRITEIRSGHINTTFLAESSDGERYILQSLNLNVFRSPEAVMGNTAKIEKAFADSSKESVTVPEYLRTADGANFTKSGIGIYRSYKYAEPLPEKSDRFYMAGYSFGTFIRRLGGRNTSLETTIENFHSFSGYFSSLTAADSGSSLKKIDSIVMRKLSSLRDTLEQVFTVDFPKRNVHNDAKISNIIFGEKCTIIDLDTAMEGYAAIDYGDMIRSVCTAEQLDFTKIRDITNGFADGLGGILTDDEIYSLYYGVLYVTGELAVRYFIDYLSGEKYFRDKTSAECLSRANKLLQQLNLFIKHGGDITAIIYKAFKKQ